MKRKFSLSRFICILVCAAFGLACVIPFLLVLSISLTPDRLIGIYGYRLLPHNPTLAAYQYILGSATSLSRSYLVTIFVTVVGTVGSLLIVSMLAYPLSRQEVKYRNKISMFVFITMLFSGGLVPTFILYTRYLKIDNTIWVLILPYLVSAWNVMLIFRHLWLSRQESTVPARSELFSQSLCRFQSRFLQRSDCLWRCSIGTTGGWR